MNNRIYFRLKAGHILNFVINNEKCYDKYLPKFTI